MNEDQRRALDKNSTVRIVFVHFRQELTLFLRIFSLINCRQYWCLMPFLVRFGMPRGSVLGPTLLSLSCNNVPDIANGSTSHVC